MTTPTPVGSAALGTGTFASSATGALNVGSDPVALYAIGVVYGNSSNTQPGATVALTQGGSPVGSMTRIAAPRSLQTDMAYAGRWAAYKLEGVALTGVIDVVMPAVLVSDDTTSDGNGKPMLYLVAVKDLVSSTNAVRVQGGVPNGSNLTGSLSGAAGDRLMGIFLTDASPAPSAVAGTTQTYGALGDENRLLLHAAGGASASVATTNNGPSATIAGWLFNLVGPAGASGDISGTVDVGGPTVAGDLGTLPPSSLSGTVDLSGPTVGGDLGVGQGTVTITLKDEHDLALPNTTVPLLKIERLDGSVAIAAASRTSNGSAQISISSAALMPGSYYIATGWSADGTLRLIDRVQAA